MISCIYIKAENDRNGNPRRAFVIHQHNSNSVSRLIGVYDEGYSGFDAIPKRYRDAAAACINVNVTPREYRSWLKAGAE